MVVDKSDEMYPAPYGCDWVSSVDFIKPRLKHWDFDKVDMEWVKEKVKEGYWILYEMETGADTDKNTRGAERPTLRRIRAAEGYYQKNLRQGWWIFYKKDGTLRDSVYYHQDTIRSKSINFF